MIHLPLGGEIKEVLCLGAHCDDIEIGCGGTLAELARARPEVRLHVAVFSGDGTRAAETRAALERLLPSKTALTLDIHDFRDGHLPASWSEVKERVEALKARVRPDLIFTHYEHDRHQDHRILCELTWNTFRNHLVLEYEIPKWDGDLSRPSVYVPLTAQAATHKIDTLLACFASQSGKRWFTRDLFAGLMRLRGMECNAESGFAEAFHARKLGLRF